MCTHLQPPHIYTLAYGMFRSLWKKFTFHEVLFQGSLEGLYRCRSLLEHSSCLSFPSQLPFLQVSNIISSPLPAHTFIFFLSVSLGEVSRPPAQDQPLQCWSQSCSFSLVIPCLTSSLISHPTYFSLLLVELSGAWTCPLSTLYFHLFTALSLFFHLYHSWKRAHLQSLPSLKNKLSTVWFLLRHLIEPALDKVFNSLLVVMFSGYFSVHFCHIWFSLYLFRYLQGVF